MAEQAHPRWHKPASKFSKDICVLNSLTSRLESFVPINQNAISWYACGPTVYSSAHLGHARAYMTFDIIRRIFEDYFGFSTNFVMNITDIDDKIILKARKAHLLEEFMAAGKAPKGHFEKALEHCKNKAEIEIDKLEQKLEKASEQQKSEIATVIKGEKLKLKSLLNPGSQIRKPEERLSEREKDILSQYLDDIKGENLTDLSIFKRHAQKFEKEFFEDMEKLHIKPPDCVTRVTEFIPEIIAFTQGIVTNGFGYTSNGSVYFDIAAFRASGHDYPKLRPKQFGNDVLLSEAEGALSGAALGEKRHAADFALWKRSKPGEPFWESPWGRGRPGWHIECSVMASETLGAAFDIHSGGEDLCFPHHDNEIAQAEAFHDRGELAQWVNYFLHAGHLGIDGLKMAKSLKNFITIRQALEDHSPRQIRICFLLQSWNKKMDFSTASLRESAAKEKTLMEFFSNAELLVRQSPPLSESPQKWSLADQRLNGQIVSAQNSVDRCFRDNFDYPKAVHAVFELIRLTNKYINGPEDAKRLLVRKAAAFVKKVLGVLGVLERGFEQSGSAAQGSEESSAAGGFVAAVLDAFCVLRGELRALCLAAAKSKEAAARESLAAERILALAAGFSRSVEKSFKIGRMEFGRGVASPPDYPQIIDSLLQINSTNKAYGLTTTDRETLRQCHLFREKVALEARQGFSFEKLFALVDEVRLERFPELGIKIEDVSRDGAAACVWKRMESALLVKARDFKSEKQNSKAASKLKNRLIEKNLEAKKIELAMLPVTKRFQRKYAGKIFLEFDQRGIPLKVAEDPKSDVVNAKRLSKSSRKKFEKDFQHFERERKNLVAKVGSLDSAERLLAELKAEISEMTANK